MLKGWKPVTAMGDREYNATYSVSCLSSIENPFGLYLFVDLCVCFLSPVFYLPVKYAKCIVIRI